ncbi:MAG: transposase [Gemmatimonadetes bacterium]|nr:transposase [Gemmatimonadota bacterium]
MSTVDPHRLYVHLAWSTLARVPALAPARRATVETHLLASCRWLGTEPIEACALSDRVHLLVRVPSVLSVHDLAARLRTDVERLLADGGVVVRWEPGYAAVTVAPRDVRRVRRRIVRLGWPMEDRGPLTHHT